MRTDISLPRTVSLLRDLVAFDTTSAKSNLACLSYVEKELKAYGFHIEYDLEKDSARETPALQRANLIARLGPDVPGGLLFSAHTDCVPVTESQWKRAPFAMTEEDGKLFGRGTTDMKGFIASFLSALPAFHAQKLEKPIYVLLSHSEELGCHGVKTALDILRKRGIKPDLCIVGEPTDMDVITAHKSRADINVLFEATGGHASKVNDPSITCANDLAMFFRHKIAAPAGRRRLGTLLGDEKTTGPASFAITSWETPTTHNVIAAQTRMHMDYRGAAQTPHAKVQELLDACAQETLRDYREEKTGLANITVDVKFGNNGFCCTDPEAIALAQSLTGKTQTGTVDYVCEAARLADFGFAKTVVCGPGNIKQAHQPDEYITKTQLVECNRMMGKAAAYCQKPSVLAP